MISVYHFVVAVSIILKVKCQFSDRFRGTFPPVPPSARLQVVEATVSDARSCVPRGDHVLDLQSN